MVGFPLGRFPVWGILSPIVFGFKAFLIGQFLSLNLCGSALTVAPEKIPTAVHTHRNADLRNARAAMGAWAYSLPLPRLLFEQFLNLLGLFPLIQTLEVVKLDSLPVK